MKALAACGTLCCMLVATGLAQAQDIRSSYRNLDQPLLLVQDKDKEEKDKKPAQAEVPDPFAQATQTPTTPIAGVNHRMIGDFPGYSVLAIVTLPANRQFSFSVPVFVPGISPGQPQQIRLPGTVNLPGTLTNAVRLPIDVRGAFKIGENESPMPEDRVFFTYNYFDNVRGLGQGASGPRTEVQTIQIGGAAIQATSVNPGFGPVALNQQRQVIGFEKSFLDGDASIGLRVPFFQQFDDGGFGEDGVGDLTAILKYALYSNRETGNVFSTGLAITAPTGPAIETVAGNIHSTLLQPYVGSLWNLGDFYVEGFSSLVFPTDARDVTLAFNDIAFGYWLYRGAPDRAVQAIIPTVECHITTPLNHRDPNSVIFVPDIVALTGGTHINLFGHSTLTVGVVTPISGPRPFDVEAVAQFNLRF